MVLYKYRSIGDIEKNEIDLNLLKLISKGELFFSNPSDFNDPFDCAYNFEINCSLAKLKNFYMERRNFSKNEIRKLFDSKSELEIRRELKEDFLRRDIIRVYCLSRSCDNTLMWSHYAQSHYGICIGFHAYKYNDWLNLNISDNQYKPFYEGYEKNLLPAIDVIYTSNRPEPLDLLSHGSKGFFSYSLTKSDDWIYEKEVRMLLPLNNMIKNPLHIKRNEIKEVIFGLRTPLILKEEVRRILKNICSIEFYQMEMSESKYSIVKKRMA